jgi:toxin ParE1/3/4
VSEYRLTKRADNDLLEIFIYGIEQFGEAQAERYQHQMIDCFRLLASNPRVGRMAETIGNGVRRHEHGRHVVLYEDAPYGVLILALVHAQNIRRLKVDN